ncbi:hypothetical protein GCM10017771_58790 [Streptomyces capitiformicae]|uniref:Uncharacterized protein n=1 Tax=Streptomyces capitiformicae TaxID=2014920 RepID=A0A918Z6U0_9ACTN|nr:hypothetical protein GCM10017771_58790 [Streptomyces capitiformicae]
MAVRGRPWPTHSPSEARCGSPRPKDGGTLGSPEPSAVDHWSVPLVDAIHAAARGETVRAPRVAEGLVARMRRPAQAPLTAGEADVPNGPSNSPSTPAGCSTAPEADCSPGSPRTPCDRPPRTPPTTGRYR